MGKKEILSRKKKHVFEIVSVSQALFFNKAVALTLPEFENLYESNAEYYFVAG